MRSHGNQKYRLENLETTSPPAKIDPSSVSEPLEFLTRLPEDDNRQNGVPDPAPPEADIDLDGKTTNPTVPKSKTDTEENSQKETPTAAIDGNRTEVNRRSQ